MADNKHDRRINEGTVLFFLFCIGSLMYMGIEIAFRGYTHWSMGIVGGLCFILIGGLNNYLKKPLSIVKQAIAGTFIITSFEFLAGIVLNLILKLNIWDYSNILFNVLGQICLPFCIVWFFLSIVAIYLDDFIRWLIFKQPFPKHK